MGGCRSFAARSVATLGTDLVQVEVLGSDHRSRRQRPEIEEEYKNGLENALYTIYLYSLRVHLSYGQRRPSVMIRSHEESHTLASRNPPVYGWWLSELIVNLLVSSPRHEGQGCAFGGTLWVPVMVHGPQAHMTRRS